MDLKIGDMVKMAGSQETDEDYDYGEILLISDIEATVKWSIAKASYTETLESLELLQK